jgi:DNA-directed RNA polymerase specialized sigma24 family protein
LTEYRQELAEDLLHDVFVQFTLARPDLEAIQNLDGYLFVTLRNMHLSHIRRHAKTPANPKLVVEFDSADVSLRSLGQHFALQAREGLARVCQYGCLRKGSSKAGSVFLLRFFHGYYPEEISKLLKSPRRAADDWIRISRREARDYLEDASRLSFVSDPDKLDPAAFPSGLTTQGFLAFLREKIFAARVGACSRPRELREFYSPQSSETTENDFLAHLVSCPNCLNQASEFLDMPLLDDRHPSDATGRNAPPPDSGGTSGSSGAENGGESGGGERSGNGGEILKMAHRRASDAYQHRPRELCVSVNGFLLGSQTIGSETSELTLIANVQEKVGFVEVLSEQDVRLAWLQVEPPPEGPALQETAVRLSDGRSLSVKIDFSGAWPQVHVKYHDEDFASALEMELSSEPSLSQVEAAESAKTAETDNNFVPGRKIWDRLAGTRASLWVRLRPAAVVALLTIVALVIHQIIPPQLSAAVLLEQSAAAERELYANPETVVHRTIRVEERRLDGPENVQSSRMVVWQSAAIGIRTRRAYDDQGRLFANELRQEGGQRKVYWRSGQVQTLDADVLSPPPTQGFWFLEPSARTFSRYVGDVQKGTVKETDNQYQITFDGAALREADGLVKITLVLERESLRPVEQVMVVQRVDGLYEYRLSEEKIEHHPQSEVGTEIFEVDPELVATASSAKPPPPPAPLPRLTLGELLNLETDVMARLDQAGAGLGEQVTVTRAPAGTLAIDAMVDTEDRKREVLRSLGTLVEHPAVKARVRTFEEAFLTSAPTEKRPGVIHQVEVAQNRVPVYAALDRHFIDKPDVARKDSVDESVREYSDQVLERSRNALHHAWAVKNLANHFSAKERELLNADSRQKFETMLRRHLTAFETETRALREKLQPVFFEQASDERTLPLIPMEDWVAAAERLFELGFTNEKTVRLAFTVAYPENPPTAEQDLRTLLPSLEEAERLSRHLQVRMGDRLFSKR